jgi:hypothetical protein
MTTIQEAKEILGENNFFGPDEWKKFSGDKFQATVIPEIPWNGETLKKPGIDQKHFLFLGLDSFNGRPLTADTNYSLGPWNLNWGDYKDNFAHHPCKFGWYLMPVGLVKGSTNLSKYGQIELLRDEYEVPTTIEYILANILYHILNGKYMEVPEYDVRTSDWHRQTGSGFKLINVRVEGESMIVGRCFDQAKTYEGIAASRKS